jgi:hypothetical protein
MSAQGKALEHFRAKVRGDNIRAAEIFFMTTAAYSGWTLPSGVIIYDTTANSFVVGKGSTTKYTITVT